MPRYHAVLLLLLGSVITLMRCYFLEEFIIYIPTLNCFVYFIGHT
jgi:hypothetical protein